MNLYCYIEQYPLFIKVKKRRFGVFIVNLEYISHHVLVFLLLTLKK